MSELKRFSQWCLVSHGHDMLPRDDGAWVRYADAQAEVERLRAVLRDVMPLLAECDCINSDRTDMLCPCKAAREALGSPDETAGFR